MPRRLIPALLLLCVATGSSAQPNPDVIGCSSPGGTPDTRIAACTRAIDAGKLTGDPLSRLYFNRAFELAAKKDYDKAIADYTEAIRVNPRYGQAFNNRGNAHADKGEYREAVADYDEALRLNANHAQAFSNRAEAWRALGDLDRAIADFDAALRTNPEYVYALHQRGRTWHAKGNLERAMADFDAAIRIDARNPLVHNSRGMTRMRRNDPERALADYSRAIALDPGYGPAYGNRALSLHVLGQHDRAVRDYSEALRFEPGNPELFLGRGRSAYFLGRVADAARDFGEGLKLRANDDYARIWLELATVRRARLTVKPAPAGETPAVADARALSPTAWPDAILLFVGGKLDAEAMLKAAEHADPEVRRGRECEADFYMGEWHAANGRPADARPRLEAAAKNCPPGFVEYSAAASALKRLPQKPAP